MTIKEAEQQIASCENEITMQHQKLVSEAKDMSAEAVRLISGSTRTKTLLPLIVSLIGILIIGSRTFLGILLIGIGVFISFKNNATAKIAKNQVNKLCSDLNTYLDNNSKIPPQ